MSNPGTYPSPSGRLAAILLSLPAARLLFHLIHQPDIPPNQALAIGLPAAAAFLLALLAPPPKSATGRLLKGMTILLLVAWGLFSLSGFLVLIISPLLFSTTMIIGLALDTTHRTAALSTARRPDSPESHSPNPSRHSAS